MSTVMVDIRSCDSWWQGNGEAAYAVAVWLRRADQTGSLGRYFNPPLTPEEREVVAVEGGYWECCEPAIRGGPIDTGHVTATKMVLVIDSSHQRN
jgi:hypothetical protein